MALRQRYDVDTPWDDPYETRTENRSANRFAFPMKITLAVDDPLRKGQLVGPGLVNDISMYGVCVTTKHKLVPKQKVTLAISTQLCPDDLCLAKAFIGPSTVRRTESREGAPMRAALQFGEALYQNIEFVMFIDYLQTMARQGALKKS